MNRQVTSFALALILFFAAIAVVSVEAHNSGCPSKRNYSPLVRRNNNKNPEQCPCAVAQATFSDAVTGITVYAQNECGQTTITGFLTGLDCPDKNKYTFFIKKCGKVIANLTDVLNVKIAEDGTAQFTALDKDLNLNCDKDGIFNVVCDSKSKSYGGYKRQNQAPTMNIDQNGASYAQAPINSI